jgi:Rieske 2Fe-2S family protein
MKDDFGAQRSLDSAANMRVVKKWFQEEADPNSPLVFAENAQTEDLVILSAGRGPIGKGRVTLSQDGKPVAPLMGQQQRFDGGISTFSYLPFVYLFGLNDHAVMFQFLPTGPRNTDVVVTWLVEPSAAETEIDLERMIWLWDVTTRQDKEIIEQNAAGVSSESYAPGPYSLFETLTARFTNHYLSEIARSCGT